MMVKMEELLMFSGFCKRYKGYGFFMECVRLAVEKEERLSAVTKEIYMPVANENHTTYFCIEKDIRTLCRHAWNEGGKEKLEMIFRRKWDKVPSNAEFIELVMEMYKKAEEIMG